MGLSGAILTLHILSDNRPQLVFAAAQTQPFALYPPNHALTSNITNFQDGYSDRLIPIIPGILLHDACKGSGLVDVVKETSGHPLALSVDGLFDAVGSLWVDQTRTVNKTILISSPVLSKELIQLSHRLDSHLLGAVQERIKWFTRAR